LTRLSRFIEEQDRFADFHFPTDPELKIDAMRLDIGARGARGNCLRAQYGGMFGDLLAFNQTDLPTAGLSAGSAATVKIARIFGNAFVRDEVDQLHVLQWCTPYGGMRVQRSHTAEKGRGGRFRVQGSKIKFRDRSHV